MTLSLLARARLLGLLSGADSWLNLVAPQLDKEEALPEWLPPSKTTPAGRHVADATRIALKDANC